MWVVECEASVFNVYATSILNFNFHNSFNLELNKRKPIKITSLFGLECWQRSLFCLRVCLDVAQELQAMSLEPLLGQEYLLCQYRCSARIKPMKSIRFFLQYFLIFYTSATFKNSPTRSIRVKNFLYKSKASRHCFLFMSKYFSSKFMMASL